MCSPLEPYVTGCNNDDHNMLLRGLPSCTKAVEVCLLTAALPLSCRVNSVIATDKSAWGHIFTFVYIVCLLIVSDFFSLWLLGLFCIYYCLHYAKFYPFLCVIS
jgi:hypothetical protein